MISMGLIDFVTINMAQRVLLKSEISKTALWVATISTYLEGLPENPEKRDSDFEGRLQKMIEKGGAACALIRLQGFNVSEYRIHSKCPLMSELEGSIRRVIAIGKETARPVGTSWGLFWKDWQNIVVAVPIFRDDRIIGGCGVVMSLQGIYQTLRRMQYLLILYILANTIVLTAIGLWSISRLTVKPLNRLVRRAEEYREEDGDFFLGGKGDSEFGRLSRSLNHMIMRISEDKNKLQATVASLEGANIELKQAQKDIIRAEKLASVGRLSSGIAHEIGNPIGIVSGYLELLRQKDIPGDEREEYLGRTEKEIERISTIIHQLLELSRNASVESRAVGVHSVIHDLVDILDCQPFMTDIKIDLDLQAKEDTIKADPDQIRQVFLNLMINAADAVSIGGSGSKGKISIRTQNRETIVSSGRKSSLFEINFIDNGTGIPPEDIDNIFDPFYTTKDPGKGTGLGLSVCFMIIEKLDGKIKAESDGKGTVMTIHLPLSDKEEILQ